MLSYVLQGKKLGVAFYVELLLRFMVTLELALIF